MTKCPFCEFENEDGALFCEQCKSDLSAVPAPAAPGHAEAVPMAAVVEDAVPMAAVVEAAPAEAVVPMASFVEAAPVPDALPVPEAAPAPSASFSATRDATDLDDGLSRGSMKQVRAGLMILLVTSACRTRGTTPTTPLHPVTGSSHLVVLMLNMTNLALEWQFFNAQSDSIDAGTITAGSASWRRRWRRGPSAAAAWPARSTSARAGSRRTWRTPCRPCSG